jgi:hypothetical protein
MNRRQFFERLSIERDAFELLINRVGFLRRMTIRGVSGRLSVKDLLADILTRELFLADRLIEISHGEEVYPCISHSALENFRAKYGFPDYESPLVLGDRRDPLVIQKYGGIELEEIVAQELAAYGNILASVGKISHTSCLDHDLYQRIAEQTFRPYRRTITEIRHWLKAAKVKFN